MFRSISENLETTTVSRVKLSFVRKSGTALTQIDPQKNGLMPFCFIKLQLRCLDCTLADILTSSHETMGMSRPRCHVWWQSLCGSASDPSCVGFDSFPTQLPRENPEVRISLWMFLNKLLTVAGGNGPPEGRWQP